MRRAKLVALAAVGLILFGCSSPVPTPTPTPQPLELTVLHTNDTLGYTEPCG